MSVKSVAITTDVKAEDFYRNMLWQNKNKLIGLTVSIVLVIIFIVVGAISFVLSAKDQMSVITFLPVLIPVCLFSFLFYSYVSTFKKQAKLMEESADTTKYVFNEDGMEIESDSASSKMSWGKFHKIVETKEDFVVFPQKNLLFPIPKRFFNQEQLTGLRNLLKEKLSDKVKLLD